MRKEVFEKYSRLRKGRDESQWQTSTGYNQGLANRIPWLDHGYLWKRSEIVKQCLRHRLLLNVGISERGEIWLA